MVSLPKPNHESILEVMNARPVTEDQAINLLQRSSNIPERAIFRHDTLMRFMKQHKGTSHSPPSPKAEKVDSNDDDLAQDDLLGAVIDGSTREDSVATPETDSIVQLRPASETLIQPANMQANTAKDNELRPNSSPTMSPSPRKEEVLQDSSIGDCNNSSKGQCDYDPMDSHVQDTGSITPEYQQISILNSTLGSPSILGSLFLSDSDISDGATVPGSPELELEEETNRQQMMKPVDEPQWDFLLPPLPAMRLLMPNLNEEFTAFDLAALVSELQHGANEHFVQKYFQLFDRATISRHINELVEGIPSVFYAVATNDDRILRLWTTFGGDVNAVHPLTHAPLLAFAIIHSQTIERDTSHIVASLLSLGASPFVIPDAFYRPYFRDILDQGPPEEELKDVDSQTMCWLTPEIRVKLARSTHLTHRYNLHRAAKIPKPSVRQQQVAHRKNVEALLGLPYFLVGQSMAASELLKKFFSCLAVPSNRPLVLVFAGPSGHGKTELARRLGYLMNLELEVVDCTIVNREMELFGGRHPYMNAEIGTPLNNFLARHHGQRSIVFLDEFEKTTREIHQALLLPFDNGEYQDRRNVQKIDCSKTIWILATNALDSNIVSFCQTHEEVFSNDEEEGKKFRLVKSLLKELKEEFLSKFGAPVTGRISGFLPFLLFSPGEQAVIAHKYLLELASEVRDPVNLGFGLSERLVGNVRTRIRRDASVCRNLASDGYHPELGARSLITAVGQVKSALVDAYLSVDDEIVESTELIDFIVDANGNEIEARLAGS